MPTIAVYNIKGGVGKTATTVNLAFLAARSGQPTLIIDLDPQSSATFYFRIKPKIKSGTKPLRKGGKQINKNIKGTDFENLDLMPADFSFRNLDLVFDQVKKPKQHLKRILAPFKKEYRYIFLDCPPNLTLLSENVLYASDMILTPVVPTTLSYRTHDKLIRFLKKERISSKKVYPFLSMVERRKKMHKEFLEKSRADFAQILDQDIPYLSDVEKMGIHRMPVEAFSPRSRSARAYRQLWAEVEALLNK